MPQTFHLVWTRNPEHISDGEKATLVSEPLSKDEALRQFDLVRELRKAAAAGRGQMRVMSTAEVDRLGLQGSVR